jgi:hypothetical protein
MTDKSVERDPRLAGQLPPAGRPPDPALGPLAAATPLS